MDCLFCKILNKELESKIVYEDDLFLVFMDKFPNAKGHMLLVPKKHIKDALEMDNNTFGKMNEVIHKMINLVYEKLGADGVILTQNNGICQEIMHYHMHILPQYKNEPNLSVEEIYNKLIEG